jgi:hypothetical protein
MVKLLVEEEGSDIASRLFENASEVAAATIGYVEARSSLARAVRDGRLPGDRRRRARAALELMWEELNAVGLEDGIVTAAGDVADRFRLRAGDAIHLASALVLAEPVLVFLTWDEELAQAAREAGLAVAP